MELPINKILNGDALQHLKELPSESIDMCMTSPPYFNQRDYGIEGQLGLEKTPEEYVKKLCDIFDEVKRVLKKTGICFVNLGDCYGGHQGKNAGYPDRKTDAPVPQIKRDSKTAKSLLCVPELFLIEMVKRGWLVRNKIVWWKPSIMPSSAKDRFTVDYEMLYFFMKSKKYYFETQYEPSQYKNSKGEISDKARNQRAVAGWHGIETGDKRRNEPQATEEMGERWCPEKRIKRSVWIISPKPMKLPKGFEKKHFATYPEELCETPIKAGCILGGVVLDPFFGIGTTGVAALRLNRNFIGIELNPYYIKVAEAIIQPYLSQRKL